MKQVTHYNEDCKKSIYIDENDNIILSTLADVEEDENGEFYIKQLSWDNGKTWSKPCSLDMGGYGKLCSKPNKWTID